MRRAGPRSASNTGIKISIEMIYTNTLNLKLCFNRFNRFSFIVALVFLHSSMIVLRLHFLSALARFFVQNTSLFVHQTRQTRTQTSPRLTELQ
jgi:hypothetical protein